MSTEHARPPPKPSGAEANSQGSRPGPQDASRPAALMLPAASLPIVHSPEQLSPKQERATARRRSFTRHSPVIRAKMAPLEEDVGGGRARHSLHHAQGQLHRLVGHIQEWIDAEKAKTTDKAGGSRRESQTELALDKLQQILHGHHSVHDDAPIASSYSASESVYPSRPRKTSSASLRKLGKARTSSSDTDYEVEQHPPSTPAVLDNTKVCSYSTPSTTDLVRRATNAEAWHVFKTEIIRLAHTLGLKSWKRVPLDHGDEIEVSRISGALTNAVYVVSPPKELPEPPPSSPPAPRRPPPKLLLRIYGPQAEHLIDRDGELAILRRLARKNIGPKLLGTFTNGRFEEYLNAQVLSANDMRDAVISQQIAKRMRELHQGISLLTKEREAGPFVWQNWDKWKERCEEVIEWLDDQIKAHDDSAPIKRSDKWRARGLVCGVEWKVFRQAVRNYRTWLESQYGGPEAIKEALVFAHNDTQYGNLLRLMPDDKASPLLQPANQYRRLVVIDFEYANANTPGFEFANHFTEWCYNYHSAAPWACVTEAYPTTEEQARFVRAYLLHRPHFVAGAPDATPVLAATSPSIAPLMSRADSSSSGYFLGTSPHSPYLGRRLRSAGSVSNFVLDSRAPPPSYSSSTGSASASGGGGLTQRLYEEEERAREEALEREVGHLLRETRLWRVANSAQWVAWGIVQAKVPGMEKALARQRRERALTSRNAAEATDRKVDSGKFHICDDNDDNYYDETYAEGEADDEGEEGEEEFDYLAYAQDRALFFWGDVLELGLVKEDEVPAELVAKAKRISC